MGEVRILLLEDSAADRELITRELKRLGWSSVRWEATREKFLQALSSFQPSLILADYRLGSFDADMALQLVLKKDPNLPFILITGTLDENTAAKFLRSGASDYVLKDRLARLGPAINHALLVQELRKQKEENEAALREHQARLHLLAEGCRDIIFRFRVKPFRAFEYISPASTATLGYKPEEHYEDPDLVFKIVHPMDRPLLERITHGELPEEPVLMRWTHRDGHVVYTETYYVPVLGSQDEVIAIQGVARDVTEREAAYQKLRQSEVRYRRLFERNPVAMWIFDVRTLEILSVNSAAVEKLGYSREELLTMRVTDIHSTAAATHAVRPVEMTIRRKDGAVLQFERIWIPTSFAGRRARLVAALDVTERNRAETELAEQENLLRRIFDAEPECVKLLDEDGGLLEMNRAGLQMIEIDSIDEVRHRPIYPFIVPEHREQFREAVRRIFRGESSTAQFEIVGSRGTRRWMETHAVPLRDAAGQITAVLAITRDVTKAKDLEEELRHSQKMEAVGRLAGGVAHDFNNILTIIEGYAGLTLDLPNISEAVRKNLTSIHNGVFRAAALTRQLLAFSRKQFIQPRVLDPTALIRNLSSLITPVIREDVQLTLQLGSDVGHIKADPGQIEQLIMNLIVNARDAMPLGGSLRIETDKVEFLKQIELGGFRIERGDYVRITVTDTGIGMTKEVLSHIFEPFFTTKELGKGTGLGLSMVYGVVQQSSGAIVVRSTPGKGTTFEVYFPMVKEPLTLRPAIPPSIARGKESIMVVEDDPELRDLVQGMLVSSGYNVVTAENGLAGLRLVEQGIGVDVIVTDLVMPGMSGRMFARQIQQRGLAVKVVFMSGYSDDFMVEAGTPGVSEGVEIIEKPFTQEDLARTIRHVLDA